MTDGKLTSVEKSHAITSISGLIAGYEAAAVLKTRQDAGRLFAAVRGLYAELGALQSSNPKLEGTLSPLFGEELAYLNGIEKLPATLSTAVGRALHQSLAGHLAAMRKRIIELYPDATLVGQARIFSEKAMSAWVKPHRKRWMILVMAVALVAAKVAWTTFTLRGHGLTGEYFKDMEFKDSLGHRLDPTIDFGWGLKGPVDFKPPVVDRFSIRWTGFLNIPKDGRYEFSVLADDAVNINLDGKALLKATDWRRLQANFINLSAGRHPIRIDYFERTGYAGIHLYWRRQLSEKREVIPAKFFSPE